jgi:hypothetical protein
MLSFLSANLGTFSDTSKQNEEKVSLSVMKITGTVLLITFSLSVPLSCLGIPLLLLVRLKIFTFGFAACKQELILNTPNSSKENDQENRPRNLKENDQENRPRNLGIYRSTGAKLQSFSEIRSLLPALYYSFAQKRPFFPNRKGR